MKKRARFVLRPRTPFSISRHRERHAGGTLDYVPGSTLRGALAAAWIRSRGLPDDTFRRVFQSGRNRYPFCYPGRGMPRPAPVTARTCKAHGGPVEAGGHGIVDGALPLAGWVGDHPETCAHDGCDERLVRYGGLVTTGKDGRLLRPERELRMHAGIRRETGSVRHGVLYGTTVVLPWTHRQGGNGSASEAVVPLELEGTGVLEEEDLGLLRELLEEVESTVFIGRSRSSGLGEMSVEIEVLEDEPGARERWDGWKAVLPRVPGAAGTPVALTLLSPAILREGDDVAFDPAAPVRDRLGLVEARSFVQETTVFGWDMEHGGPKPTADAVAPGSVVLGVSTLPEGDLLARVEELELEGIGERLEEGFGQVLAWDPVLLGGTR